MKVRPLATVSSKLSSVRVNTLDCREERRSDIRLKCADLKQVTKMHANPFNYTKTWADGSIRTKSRKYRKTYEKNRDNCLTFVLFVVALTFTSSSAGSAAGISVPFCSSCGSCSCSWPTTAFSWLSTKSLKESRSRFPLYCSVYKKAQEYLTAITITVEVVLTFS